ncbi:tRNA lysidine(34) synthetase TilS [Spiroplasma endosymbiont of Othius punctulatus]|uniref:tRNA lysidine(34) synthetase TilS n=1 Tax=Spiroplasma endosymbiont of Othius punctulatus TaxID=3066289 RepID=UPI0030CBDE10
MDLKEFKVVVGASGGPDSMYLLNKLFKEKNYKDIIVCHVNYNFREDSLIDQNVVEKFCIKNQIKFKVLNTKHVQGNFEEWARIVRYDFFVDVINENGFDKILIAHNFNDHIETFTMQTLRNNLVDYYGIKEITTYKNVEIMRPILNLRKSNILIELEAENISYAIDSTNDDIKFLRNKVRQNLEEETFDRVEQQIIAQNRIVEKFRSKYETQYLSDTFDTTIFDDMNDVEINRFVYCWIRENDKTNSVLKKKKKFIKEVVKQLLSKKSLEITTDNLKIVKKLNIVSVGVPK